jgi:MerR family transcriptional regulator/heat shock protein HspR
MVRDFWTHTEVIRICGVEESFLSRLVKEDILCPTCVEGSSAQMFSSMDLERLRLAKLLMEEMDVNLPGVEVILRMRQNLIDMRNQFDDILEDMCRQLKNIHSL